jgi:hypothetical protein
VRILNGLRASFEEVRILKDLTQSESKVESLESEGKRKNVAKSGYVLRLVHAFLNTEGAESKELVVGTAIRAA